MAIAIVTGSAGLVGGAAVRLLSSKGFTTVGIDNDLRSFFFGPRASTSWNRRQLEESVPRYQHRHIDIRDGAEIDRLFRECNRDVRIIIHAAAQPSHDWAARDPKTDFTVNAVGTLTLLEAARAHCPEAIFLFTSSSKVYGDTPNRLPLVELETRWEVDPVHPFAARGIDESMPIDQSMHSLFGASKLAADVLVQEYGRYFGMKTAVFRGGCLTGGAHAAVEPHRFLSHMVRCCLEGRQYTVFGYKGKQVRDNIHAEDLVGMFWSYCENPRPGEVYNAGGGRHSNCSILEAIVLCEEVCGQPLRWCYSDAHRTGDHVWYISDVTKFRTHYPGWSYRYDLRAMLNEICAAWRSRLASPAAREALP